LKERADECKMVYVFLDDCVSPGSWSYGLF